MNKVLAVTSFVLAILGCSANRYHEEIDAINNGGYYWASQRLQARANGGDDTALALLGALYYDHMGDKPKGLQMITLAARRGNRTAQNMLLKAGAPIPSSGPRSERRRQF